MSSSTEGSLKIKDILYVSQIVEGCLMLMHNVIETCKDDYAKIICITRTFSDTGENVCANVFSLLEQEITAECRNKLRTVITLVKEVITTLKILRLSATCTSFDNCDIKDYIHHHSDILGPPVSHSILNKDPMCCIASMSCLLFRLFSTSVHPRTSNDILKHLKMCGVCCCVNPSFVLKSLFDGYAMRDPETQKLILATLGKHLFPQLGLVSKCQRRCTYCSKYLSTAEDDQTLDNVVLENGDVILRCNAENMNLVFTVYNELLNLTSTETLENVSKHLLEVFSICISELKIQIFVKVIFPQFLNLNTDAIELSNSLFSTKVKCFLSILSHVLSNVSLYCAFIKVKGIPVLLPLLLKPEFRELTLNVIKVLIYSENEYRSNNLDVNSEFYSFPASRTLCNVLSEQSETFIQKLNLFFKLSSTFSELLMSENETVSSTTNDSPFAVTEDFSENVSLICDMWNLFRELVLSNSLNSFNNFYIQVLTSGFNLLILMLQNLSTMLRIKIIVQSQKTEKILLLMQSLITVLVNQKNEVCISYVIFYHVFVQCNFYLKMFR